MSADGGIEGVDLVGRARNEGGPGVSDARATFGADRGRGSVNLDRLDVMLPIAAAGYRNPARKKYRAVDVISRS
jgi:hypothetical protein